LHNIISSLDCWWHYNLNVFGGVGHFFVNLFLIASSNCSLWDFSVSILSLCYLSYSSYYWVLFFTFAGCFSSFLI